MGIVNNTTTNTLLSKKNEELVVQAFLKLVEHLTNPPQPLPSAHQEWLDKYKNAGQPPKDPYEDPQFFLDHLDQVPKRTVDHNSSKASRNRIKQLEQELAQANAKLSKRI